jgi:choline dehydrogenase-like flavoprotein
MTIWQKKMQNLATCIRNAFFSKTSPVSEGNGGTEEAKAPGTNPSEDAPPMKLADFGVVAHEVGTMRMKQCKEDAKGVVDENLQFIGLSNLFVCDLSVFPVSPPANPTLTLTALAMRLADFLEKVEKKDKDKDKDNVNEYVKAKLC